MSMKIAKNSLRGQPSCAAGNFTCPLINMCKIPAAILIDKRGSITDITCFHVFSACQSAFRRVVLNPIRHDVSVYRLSRRFNTHYPLLARRHIVLNNARYHYSKVVKKYLKKNDRINLIERIWRFFKSNVR